MKPVIKIKNNEIVWSYPLRVRCLDVVVHNGKYYQNISGINSEPSLLIDWIVVFGGGTGDSVLTEDVPVILSGGKTIGVIKNGDILPTGLTYNQFVKLAATEYLLPKFNSFSMQGQVLTIELGSVLAGAKNFIFTLANTANIKPNSLSILDITNLDELVSGAPITSPQSANIGSVSKADTGSHEWKAIAENTNNTVFESNIFKVDFSKKIFYGYCSATPVNSAQVRALPQNRFNNESLTFNLLTGIVEGEFDLFIPAERGLSQVVDLDALGAVITASYVLQTSTFIVKDFGGNDRFYKHYKMEIAGAYPVNHRHEIKIV